MAIKEGVPPYPSCLCQGFFARATTKGNNFTRRRNSNNNNNNNNRSRDSVDLLGLSVKKF